MFRTGRKVPVEYKLAKCAFSFWDVYHPGAVISVHSGVITILIMMMMARHLHINLTFI